MTRFFNTLSLVRFKLYTLHKKFPLIEGIFYGAGNGNRSRIKSLGSSRSTIELYPQKQKQYTLLF